MIRQWTKYQTDFRTRRDDPLLRVEDDQTRDKFCGDSPLYPDQSSTPKSLLDLPYLSSPTSEA
jgi:hypothetical protein